MHITDKGGAFEFHFSLDEVRFFHQLFNEACNGLCLSDFKGRIGDFDQAERAMQDLRRIYEDVRKAPSDEPIVLLLNVGQARLYRNVVQTVRHEIEDWEFQTRTGETRTRATQLLAAIEEVIGE